MNTFNHCPHCGTEFEETIPLQNGVPVCPKCLKPATEPKDAAMPLQNSNQKVLEPGTKLGEYQILEVVGQGGMGLVYTAIQLSLQRKVAVKTLAEQLAQTESFQRRFERESLALASLDHPNIVRIIDRGVHEGVSYFVMEYVDGMDLRAYMEGHPRNTDKAIRIVCEVCDALDYAHRRGIIHRDIKPENILIDKFDRVKITDFGLSRVLFGNAPQANRLTMTQVVMGTLDYISPEQKDGLHKVDERADLYSLAVVLYELLTGRVPRGNFDPPSKLVRTPVALDQVILKALSADPAQRYRNVNEFREAIQRAYHGDPSRPFEYRYQPRQEQADFARDSFRSGVDELTHEASQRLKGVHSRLSGQEVRSALLKLWGGWVLIAVMGHGPNNAAIFSSFIALFVILIFTAFLKKLNPSEGRPRFALRKEGFKDWTNMLWLAYVLAIIVNALRGNGQMIPVIAVGGAFVVPAICTLTRPFFRYPIPSNMKSDIPTGTSIPAGNWSHEKPENQPPGARTESRWHRSTHDKMVAGVCGGIGETLAIDPLWIRLIWVVGLFVTMGFAVLAYLILALLMPRDDELTPNNRLIVEREWPQDREKVKPVPGTPPVAQETMPTEAWTAPAAEQSAQVKPPRARRKRTAWANWSIFWSFSCLLLEAFFLFVGVWVAARAPGQSMRPMLLTPQPATWFHIVLGLILLSAAMSIFCGTVAKIRIKKSQGMLKGSGSAAFARLVGMVTVFVMTLFIGFLA
jgi:serine/threonine protein kinase/phage shock protein PspC (stress-responsive transcriptional regulator)